MRMQSFHLSTQGASHIKKNKECQDSSESFFNEKCAIAIVCDGHGGDDYVRSATGSSFASKVAKESILNFIENVDEDELKRHHDQLIHGLEASIISAWNELVHEHCEKNPFTDEEIAVLSERAKRKYLQENRIESAYGTTLIAVAITHRYWFGIHIGDGKCVAINPESRFVQPIPWDEKCFLNATTSICDSDALERFRYFFSEKLPVAVFVGSDGIDDCFSSDEQLNNLYKTILYSFATTNFDAAIADLRDYLPRLSAKGSGDDVSVAAVLDLDAIGEIEAVKDFDEEKEKARVEENARIAAQRADEERKRVEAERADQLREQQAKRRQLTVRCPNCGAKLMPNAKFCSECGAKMGVCNRVEGSQSVGDEVASVAGELKITKIMPFGSDAFDDKELPEQVETQEPVIGKNDSNSLASDDKVLREPVLTEDPMVEAEQSDSTGIEAPIMSQSDTEQGDDVALADSLVLLEDSVHDEVSESPEEDSTENVPVGTDMQRSADENDSTN